MVFTVAGGFVKVVVKRGDLNFSARFPTFLGGGEGPPRTWFACYLQPEEFTERAAVRTTTKK